MNNTVLSSNGYSRKRDAWADYWRFFACLIIMAHHLYTTGIDVTDYPFRDGFIFVEFFFLLSGYYMFRHFQNDHPATVESGMCESVRYTINRFVRFFPVCAIAVTAQYVMVLLNGSESLIEKLKILAGYPVDLFLITSFSGRPLVSPLWYLSSMLLVSPFVGVLMQRENRVTHATVSLFLLGLYYGFILPYLIIPVGKEHVAGDDLARAFICMYAGLGLAIISDKYRQAPGKMQKALFAVGNGCMLIVAGMAYMNRVVYFMSVALFACAIVFCCEKVKKQSRIATFLGTVSFSMYVFNWVIGTAVSYLCMQKRGPERVLVFYVLTCTVSLIFIWLSGYIEKHTRSQRISIIRSRSK